MTNFNFIKWNKIKQIKMSNNIQKKVYIKVEIIMLANGYKLEILEKLMMEKFIIARIT